jgi:hypothetical protein
MTDLYVSKGVQSYRAHRNLEDIEPIRCHTCLNYPMFTSITVKGKFHRLWLAGHCLRSAMTTL